MGISFSKFDEYSLISQQRDNGKTVYSLHLTFGLLVLPEFVPFSHTAYLEAEMVHIGMYQIICNSAHNKTIIREFA